MCDAQPQPLSIIATAHRWYGCYLVYHRRFDQAVEEIRIAMELDPLSLPVADSFGKFFYFAGRNLEAIETVSCRWMLWFPSTRLERTPREDEEMGRFYSGNVMAKKRDCAPTSVVPEFGPPLIAAGWAAREIAVDGLRESGERIPEAKRRGRAVATP